MEIGAQIGQGFIQRWRGYQTRKLSSQEIAKVPPRLHYYSLTEYSHCRNIPNKLRDLLRQLSNNHSYNQVLSI